MIPGRAPLRIPGRLHQIRRSCTPPFPGAITPRLFSLYPPTQQQEAQQHGGPFGPPLRILFCGSDHFSATSLKALYQEHQHNQASVASIDVVCRKDKRVGRGLKTIREGGVNLFHHLERREGLAVRACGGFNSLCPF